MLKVPLNTNQPTRIIDSLQHLYTCNLVNNIAYILDTAELDHFEADKVSASVDLNVGLVDVNFELKFTVTVNMIVVDQIRSRNCQCST